MDYEDLIDMCDDSTTEVTIETPDDFKCDRCTATYAHTHNVFKFK